MLNGGRSGNSIGCLKWAGANPAIFEGRCDPRYSYYSTKFSHPAICILISQMSLSFKIGVPPFSEKHLLIMD